jgi:hypothetical protein
MTLTGPEPEKVQDFRSTELVVKNANGFDSGSKNVQIKT